MLMTGVFGLLDAVEVPMRDGAVLRADVWLPGGEGSWPVLLQRTPYNKDDAFGTQYISALNFRAALRQGFAVVVQDTRGRHASDGVFDPFATELDDGVDTIAWLREQRFCNGQIAMFGSSYVGATQVLAAVGHADGLVAISPQLTTGRHGETWMYRSGAIELSFDLLWILEALAPIDLPRRSETLDENTADRAHARLVAMQHNPAAEFARLPVLDDELMALAPYARTWLDNARAAAARDDRATLEAIKSSTAAMLVTCGWNDLFLEGGIELFEAARSRWRDAAEVPDRLVIGPWSHGNPTDWQGDLWHGYSASTASVSDDQLGFFKANVEGRFPASPMVRYFRSGSNTWHAAPDWPLPGTLVSDYYLIDDALTSTLAISESTRSYVSDTLHAVPTVGGASFMPGLLLGKNSGPKDQRTIEDRDDVLVYTSDVLEADTEVTGLVEAILWVSSSAVTCDWTVRLCEVDATGRSLGLVDGIERWTPPASNGQPTEVLVNVGHVSHLFSKGSRIRLQIASSNFPRFDRNPQSAIPSMLARREDFVVAVQHLWSGPNYPSRVRLPVIANSFPAASSLAHLTP